MDFEYLGEVPVLTIDVNEDFKNSKNKSGNMIEKVRDNFQVILLKCAIPKNELRSRKRL